MKERNNFWHINFGMLLLILSVLLYFLHYIIFKDAHHIFIFLLADVAFIPMHVLLITLIIDRLLNKREKRAMFSKLNMIVGTFFNEIGTTLVKVLPAFDEHPEQIAPKLLVDEHWTDKQFFQVARYVLHHDFAINSERGDLEALQKLLIQNRSFLLRLLENPSLTEYESFTDLLLAVFHLSDELSNRETVHGLPASDYEHLSQDIKRVYGNLLFEWLRYMNHLKRDYPYLFSLEVRTNPFDLKASPIVQSSKKSSFR